MSAEDAATAKPQLRDPDTEIVTLSQHIMAQQRMHPTATGEFSFLLDGITMASKIVAAKVRRAGIADVLGITGEQNIQGEIVQKLDRIANETVYRMLDYRGIVGVLGSEEDEEPRFVERGDGPGKYIVLFDPIDGSSNIDVNVSVGTIFSILRRDADDPFEHDPMQDVLQPGIRQLAAGYIVYGSSVVLCYTTGAGVHMFTLDPLIGAYVLTMENIMMPETGKIYSVNEANRDSFPEGYRQYLDWAKTKEAGPYTLRYIGSLVADFHRTLLKGGIFMYPPTAKAPGGKLRLMYEANPMAFLAEQAGGAATDGEIRIVEKQPTALHQRTPLVIGSQTEVNRVHEFLGKELPNPARKPK